MTTHKLKAIALYSMKYKENSAIVHLYTNAFGRQSYLVNGIRGAKSKGSAALFHPLFLLDIEAYKRPKVELQRLKEFQLAVPLQNIPFSITKSTLALFISELLNKLIREEEPNSELFEFLYHSVLMLDELNEGVANFHLHFLTQLSKYVGFYPHSDGYMEGSYFDMKTGEFSVIRPKHPQFFSAENSSLLNRLISLPVSELGQVELNRHQRRSFLNSMLDFYGYHFENLSPIRSLQVMNEVFDG